MKNILLVEDDPILLNMYQTKLAMQQYAVVTAVDGDEGLQLALSKHPDLILLDIAMPKMDGLTMMENLRKDDWGKTVPIIILTNFEANDRILRGIVTHHPAYYLLKSEATPQGVIDKINEVIEANKKPSA